MPGSYRAVLRYGDQNSETIIKVKSDPRIPYNVKARQAVYDALKEFEHQQETMRKAVKQLVESKNIVSEFSEKLSKKDKKLNKEALKRCKELTEKIDSLLALYFGKEDKRQGITSDPEVSVTERVGIASYYTSTRQNGITNTERSLIKHAKTAIESALEATNTFFTEEWGAFRTDMEAKELSPFKPVETFKIKN